MSVPTFVVAIMAIDVRSWDTRSDNTAKPSIQEEGHEAEINALAFAPSSPHLLLTGSSDNVSRP